MDTPKETTSSSTPSGSSSFPPEEEEQEALVASTQTPAEQTDSKKDDKDEDLHYRDSTQGRRRRRIDSSGYHHTPLSLEEEPIRNDPELDELEHVLLTQSTPSQEGQEGTTTCNNSDQHPFETTPPSDSTTTTTTTTPRGWSLWWSQGIAVGTAIALRKVRTPLSTCMEIWTPILVMVGLVASFQLSDKFDMDAQLYDAIELDLTHSLVNASSGAGHWVSLANHVIQQQKRHPSLAGPETSSSSSLGSQSNHSKRQLWTGLLEDELEEKTKDVEAKQELGSWWWQSMLFQGLEEEQERWDSKSQFQEALYQKDQWLDCLQFLDCGGLLREHLLHHYHPSRFLAGSSTTSKQHSSRLLQHQPGSHASQDPTEEDINNKDHDPNDTQQDDPYRMLQQLYHELQSLLTHPLPAAPTLQDYVQLSRSLSTLLQVKTSLPRVFTDSRLGRQWGNLLTLGTIHVVGDQKPNHQASPSTFPSPVVQALLDYLWTYSNVPLEIVYHNDKDDSHNSTSAPSPRPLSNSSSSWHLLVRVHPTQAQALRFIDRTQGTERTWALLDVSHIMAPPQTQISDSPKQLEWKYTIRMNTTTLPNTARITNFVSIGLNTRYQRYFLSGYLTWQRTLNEFAMHYYHQQSSNETTAISNAMCSADTANGIWSMPMPTAAYHQNAFFLAVGFLLGLTMVMAYLYPMSRLVKSMVEEKELRLRETMLIMGLSPAVYWVAWLLSATILFGLIGWGIATTLTTNVLFMFFGQDSKAVLSHSSPALILIWVLSFSTATIGLCFCLAALFSKAKLAATVAPMALFATLLPRYMFFGYNQYEATTAKKVASLLPATAFAFGADIVADYEYAELGVHEWNSKQGEYSFHNCIQFLLLDTVLYLALAWYLDQVVPRDYGAPQPVWFLCLPKFWKQQWSSLWSWTATMDRQGQGLQRSRSLRRSRRQVSEEHEALVAPSSSPPSTRETSSSSSSSTVGEDEADHEPVLDRQLIPGIVARDLYKVYAGSHKRSSSSNTVTAAVNHLDLTLYENQITTLLGHNGAGKTTTISLLTGLYQPTSGDATIYGHSITDNVAAARQSIGICPQQNVLFDSLTVQEHIFFFQRLKGLVPSAEGARRMAQDIGLQDFLHVASSALSGGNKRKLCVLAALSGNPKFVVLDEPTSGMDPGARRKTWEVLRKRRLGRSILLCTHFMDEAEILSDRIAILKAGQLRCSGSPLFLKKRFGVGYNLTALMELGKPQSPVLDGRILEEAKEDIEAQVVQTPSPVITGQLSMGQAAEQLLSLAQIHVPRAEIERIGGKEITIRLPSDNEASFPQLFDDLQTQRSNLSIGALGVENASLEEVFIQLADDEANDTSDSTNDEEECHEVDLAHAIDSDERIQTLATSPTTSAGFVTQIGLLYWKRVVCQRRDLKGLFFAVVVPVLLVALALIILTITPPVVGPPIELSPNLYSSSNVGKSTMTDVIVGGGISAKRPTDTESTYKDLHDWSLDTYDHLNFDRRQEDISSHMVSLTLLDSINAHDHYERYGALALKDRLNISITVDWSIVYEEMKYLFQIWNGTSTNSTDPEPVDITDSVKTYLAPTLHNIDSTEDGLLFHFQSTPQDFDGLWKVLKFSQLVKGNGDPSANSTTMHVESIVLYESEGILTVSNMTVKSGSLVLADHKTVNLSLFSDRSVPSESMAYHFHVNTQTTILHNASSAHAVAAYYQHYMEFLFKKCTAQSSSRLVAENYPLPLTTQQSLEVKTVLSVLASMFILIPYCLIPGFFVVYLVKEKSSKSKHLQLVSGTDLTAYWISSYLFDVSRFSILTVLVMPVFLLYGQDSAQVFVGSPEAFLCTALLTFGYGLSVLPFSYLLARGFSNHSSAQIAVISFVFLTGFVAVNAIYVMSSVETTEDLAEFLRPVFHLWPPFNVGSGLIAMSASFWSREILFQETYPLDWDVAGKHLAFLYGLILPYFLLLLFVEFAHDGGAGGVVGKMLRRLNENVVKMIFRCLFGVEWTQTDDGRYVGEDRRDTDVLEEEAFVRENGASLRESTPILFQNLWKIYLPSVGVLSSGFDACRRACSRPDGTDARHRSQPKLAVRGMSTAVGRGEIYALLGANGAGKSTTLGMLTGDVSPTRGNIYVAGYDATSREDLNGVTQARQHVGFCPQVDPLLDLMSVRETLTLFGRLRGIGPADIDRVVDQLLHRLLLTPHVNKTCESLSGGNKRKVSLGIALIGEPEVLLIDESSSGLDPLAKRRMWNLISAVSKDKTVVLTTHSMEEAEALCTRAGIMAKGQLLCLGSVQHLKTKYLDGYTIDVFCSANSSSSDLDNVVNDIVRSTLPGSTLAERHGRFLRFDFSNMSCIGLGTTFRNLETLKQQPDSIVESYSIAQCSLEQVFVQLSDRVSG